MRLIKNKRVTYTLWCSVRDDMDVTMLFTHPQKTKSKLGVRFPA